MLPHVVQVHLLRRSAELRAPAAPAGSVRRLAAARDSFRAQLAALKGAFRPLTPAVRVATPGRVQSTVRARATATGATGDGLPSSLDPWLASPRQRALADAIAHASDHAGVAPDLSLAVAAAESSLDPSARSADGRSSGTFQVTAPTASDIRRRMRSGELARPPGADDVALGVAHLSYLHDLFARDASLGGALRTVPVGDTRERSRFAVAAYNAGEGRVARAQEQAAALRRDPTRYESIRAFLPSITQRYVDRVMRYSGRAATTLHAA